MPLTLNSVKSTLKSLCLGLISLVLIACGSGEGDDLELFMQNAGNTMSPKIKPLPEVKTYIAFQFNADGSLADPFHPRKVIHKSGVLQPNLKRPKETMEGYAIESVSFVGMISKNNLTYALLKTPDNGIQQVKIGNFVGQNFGLVTQITESELVLKEIVQDDISGDWVERVSKLALQNNR